MPTTGRNHTTSGTRATDRRHFEWLKSIHGEDPARFLSPAVSLDPVPRIARLESVQLCDDWLYVAHELGVQQRHRDRIRARREYLGGASVETADTKSESEPTPSDGESVGEMLDRLRAAEADAEAPIDDADAATESQFDAQVDQAREIASSFEKVDRVRTLLERETDRDDPRRYVIAALNQRLATLQDREGASAAGTEADGEQQTVATDGGGRE